MLTSTSRDAGTVIVNDVPFRTAETGSDIVWPAIISRPPARPTSPRADTGRAGAQVRSRGASATTAGAIGSLGSDTLSEHAAGINNAAPSPHNTPIHCCLAWPIVVLPS